MDTLKIPELGLVLDGSASKEPGLPAQAFTITLDDSVVRDMVSCVKAGGKIELALGNSPTFHYGSATYQIHPPRNSFPYDLYRTKPFESTRRAVKLPNSSSLFTSPKKASQPSRSGVSDAGRIAGSQVKPDSSKSSTSSSLDADVEALQNSFAAYDAARERTQVFEGIVPSRKVTTKPKGKLFSGTKSNPRSVSTSPSLPSNGQPASPPTLSASQQAMERAKEQRFTLVHELAFEDQSKDRLKKKWEGSTEDLHRTLTKVAEYNESTKTWSLRKTYWKELDVWKYDYKSQDERDKAIDHAIRQYDRQRLSSSEPEWQKLLPVEERGQGKCLSRLQANLARGPTRPPAKPKSQKGEDSSTSKEDKDSREDESRLAGGEPMARSGSNTSLNKAKKASSSEAQTRRLLGKTKTKPAVQKPSPSKGRGGGSKNGGRILSKEIIENSDSSGDEPAVSQPKADAKSKQASPSKETLSTVRRVTPKESRKETQSVGKRRRDEDDSDDSTSSSGTPLARRLPQKLARHLKPLPDPASSDGHPPTRAPASSMTYKSNKNTSPVKSSPLASSPPTNASDMESDEVAPGKKRKAVEAERPPKRQAVASIPTDVMRQAHKFKLYYRKYEALHWEISGLKNPPRSKLDDLLDMRDRLAGMKKDIYRQYASV